MPCQAQYLEFEAIHNEGYSSYMLFHEISKPDSVYMAVSSISLETGCRPDTIAVLTMIYPSVTDSLTMIAASMDTTVITRLKAQQIGLSAHVSESHLKELNTWNMIYTIGRDTLSAYAIREGLEEYLKQIQDLPSCP